MKTQKCLLALFLNFSLLRIFWLFHFAIEVRKYFFLSPVNLIITNRPYEKTSIPRLARVKCFGVRSKTVKHCYSEKYFHSHATMFFILGLTFVNYLVVKSSVKT